MLCKRIKSTSAISWGIDPHNKAYLATGTLEGILTDDFQSYSKLEIFDVRSHYDSTEEYPIASLNTESAMQSLAWCRSDENSTQSSLIAGAMSDGVVKLWTLDENTSFEGEKNLDKDDEERFSRLQINETQTLRLEDEELVGNCLEYGGEFQLAANSSSSNRIFVIDLKELSSTRGASESAKINCKLSSKGGKSVEVLKWNTKVKHILVSCASDGSSCIWDLRQKKAVINLKPSRGRSNTPATSVSWNAHQALQLAIAFGTPNAEIWDLRKAIAPKLTFQCEKGITHVDWNPHDPKLILSASENGGLFMVNSRGKLLCNYKCEKEGFLQLTWSPVMPSYFASSSNSGQISIRSVQGTGKTYTPEWLKHTSGTSYGFCDRRVDIVQEKSLRIKSSQSKSKDFSDSAKDFLKNLDSDSLAEYCNKKAENSKEEKEKTLWKFVEILFRKNEAQLFLSQLGFSEELEEAQNEDTVTEDKTEQSEGKDSEESDEDQLDDVAFFDKIANEGEKETDFCSSDELKSTEKRYQKQKESKKDKKTPKLENELVKKVGDNYLSAKDFEQIEDFLIVGNFTGAVKECVKLGNFSDALFIASYSPQLWEKTQNEYLKTHQNPSMKRVLSLLVAGNMDELVCSSDLTRWRKTLALALTFAEDKSQQLCRQLGDSLNKAGMEFEALLCYLCSRDVEKITKKLFENTRSLEKSIDSFEKVFLVASATSNQGNEKIEALLVHYIKKLLTEGSKKIATDFIVKFVGDLNQIKNFELRNISEILGLTPKDINDRRKSKKTLKRQKSTEKKFHKISAPKKRSNSQNQYSQNGQNRQKPLPQNHSTNATTTPSQSRQNEDYPKRPPPPPTQTRLPNKNTTTQISQSRGSFPSYTNLLNPRNPSQNQTQIRAQQDNHSTESRDNAYPPQRTRNNNVSSHKNNGQYGSRENTFSRSTVPKSLRTAEQVPSHQEVEISQNLKKQGLKRVPPNMTLARKSRPEASSNAPRNNARHNNITQIPANNLSQWAFQTHKDSQYDQNLAESAQNPIPPTTRGTEAAKPASKGPKTTKIPPGLLGKSRSGNSNTVIKQTPEKIKKPPHVDRNPPLEGISPASENGEENSELTQGLPEAETAVMSRIVAVLGEIGAKSLGSMEKLRIKDTIAKLRILKEKMKRNEIPTEVLDGLCLILNEIEAGNFAMAKKAHVNLMVGDWPGNREWLSCVNTLILLSKRHCR